MEKRVRSWNEQRGSRVWTVCKHGRSYQPSVQGKQWIAEMHAHRQVRERAVKIYGKAASPRDRVARGASATIL